MHGVLPLWKPKGLTSHDCVMKIRKIFGIQKVGHTGTLDPEVEGVLVICLGNATKISSYLTTMKKTYIAECSLGVATETEDSQGQVIEQKTVKIPPTEQEIENTLRLFRGNITQIPPMYSAVRVKGKRLYEYARANKEVDRPAREVTIYGLTNLSTGTPDSCKIKMKVDCSEGTYIRTLCVDIGKKLGYPAHMSSLTRIAASSFVAAETVTFEKINQAKRCNKESSLLIPMAHALRHMDHLYISDDLKDKVLHGQKFKKPNDLKTNPFLMMNRDRLLAIYQIHPEKPEQIKPVRVFMENNKSR